MFWLVMLGQEQNEEALMEEIVKSHVVCVVYSLTDEAAMEKLTTYWLPLIKHCTEGPQLKPVILAGNKADLPYDMDAQSEKLSQLLEEYAEVETGIECSAKELLNVSEFICIITIIVSD
ncbi:mitochondrial Rho GTPase 2-like [Dysidea avara]|uniref:mitochondrial Rho GTPase 2-like n=1 Tax=Dysidea avara TaxID=196820 RepID=UPI0033299C74